MQIKIKSVEFIRIMRYDSTSVQPVFVPAKQYENLIEGKERRNMSQAKVDRYKEEKKNRQQIMKKEKREWMLFKAGGAVFALLIVAWLGFSVVQTIRGTDNAATDNTPVVVENYTVNTDALNDYLDTLTVD